uniref:Uncharacterized protein n=1 Tax=Timema monikensis TaxID=170555 RepID=A0A7R9HVB3_9NEOP|nr:unnamed protein product [Timema monikensis]
MARLHFTRDLNWIERKRVRGPSLRRTMF